MKFARQKQLIVLLIASTALLVSGCSKTSLYTQLPEKEANEIMAILQERDIACEKVKGDDEGWDLSVESSKFSEAVDILSQLGRPREKFVSMDELFPKTGLVSSPAEQQIRLTYGTEQKLAKTITVLPEVVSAHVHLVLPENNPFGKSVQPSAASVVVVHRPDAHMESAVPLIKEIVIGGVAALKVDAVSVQLVEAEDPVIGVPPSPGFQRNEKKSYTEIFSVRVSNDSAPKLIAVLVVGALAVVFGIAMGCMAFFKRSPAAVAA